MKKSALYFTISTSMTLICCFTAFAEEGYRVPYSFDVHGHGNANSVSAACAEAIDDMTRKCEDYPKLEQDYEAWGCEITHHGTPSTSLNLTPIVGGWRDCDVTGNCRCYVWWAPPKTPEPSMLDLID